VSSLSHDSVGPLGRDTPGAIRSGLWYGQVGAIRELVGHLTAAANRPPRVLVTGGNGRDLAAALGDHARFEPDLALRGLAHVAQVCGVQTK
jgi:type III pantothenate kinase